MSSKKERVLVVAPHHDDESFGCLGTLLLHKKHKDLIAFLWMTDSNGTRGWKQRYGAEKVAKHFKAKYALSYGFPDQKLDTLSLVDLITPIEQTLALFKPTIIYIPFIGDLNKDHRLTSEAAMVGCRPYKKNSPREVYMYRIPGTTEFGLDKFTGGSIIAIDAAKKTELLKKWYPDELINGRHYVEYFEEFQRWPK